MSEATKKPDVRHERPWEDDPYRGVDVTIMRQRLKMTPAERLRIAVDESNTLRRFSAHFRK